ncbi:MAG: LysM peptidoglycan-binding domain-containing protein [Omnitrophica WOR_2 bacterium]
MNIKRFLLVIFIAVLALALQACLMPASTSPASTPTTGSGFPVPGTETMGLFETIATQTAMALQGGGAPATEAPQPTVEQPAGAAQPTAKPTKAPKATATPETNTAAEPTATLANIVVPKATQGVPKSYTLKNGEYPYCIARRFNVNPSELLNLNGLTSASTVYAGMKLSIPQTGDPFPDGRSLHSHPATYTVKSGDTIYTVACYYGDIDPLVLAQVNGLNSPYKLTSGQTLQIP